MNKYEEALKVIRKYNPTQEYVESCDTLKEAIEKAEKYDNQNCEQCGDYDLMYTLKEYSKVRLENKNLEAKAKWYDLIIKKRVDINNDIFYCRNYNGYLAEKENDAVDEMMLTIEEWCKLKEIVGGVE